MEKEVFEKEKTIRLTAGGIVINSNGDILLVRQTSGSWLFPKGGIELQINEIPLVTAKREIREETGIKEESLELVRDFPAYERPDMGKESVLQKIQMFLFKTNVKEVKSEPEFLDEIAKARWVKKEEVVNLLSAPKDKEFFLNFLNKYEEGNF